jgi:hypothetical protein
MKYKYVDYDGEQGVEIIKDEDDIIDEYLPFWAKEVARRHGVNFLKNLTIKDCIDDWVVVNWAYPLTEEHDNGRRTTEQERNQH